MEGRIRKERQQTIYKQQQLRRQIGEGLAWLFLVVIVGGFLLLVTSIYFNKARADGYIYKPKDYTKQQKIWQGKIKKKNIRPVD